MWRSVFTAVWASDRAAKPGEVARGRALGRTVVRILLTGRPIGQHSPVATAVQAVKSMPTRMKKLLIGLCSAGVFALQGCIFQDPDVGLRAGLSFASDLAIFLLENTTAGL